MLSVRNILKTFRYIFIKYYCQSYYKYFLYFSNNFVKKKLLHVFNITEWRIYEIQLHSKIQKWILNYLHWNGSWNAGSIKCIYSCKKLFSTSQYVSLPNIYQNAFVCCRSKVDNLSASAGPHRCRKYCGYSKRLDKMLTKKCTTNPNNSENDSENSVFCWPNIIIISEKLLVSDTNQKPLDTDQWWLNILIVIPELYFYKSTYYMYIESPLKNWPIPKTTLTTAGSGVALLWHKSGQLHENSAITHHAAFQIKNPELWSKLFPAFAKSCTIKMMLTIVNHQLSETSAYLYEAVPSQWFEMVTVYFGQLLNTYMYV